VSAGITRAPVVGHRGAPVLPRGRRVHHLAVLGQLVRRGEAKAEVLEQAIGKYRLDVPGERGSHLGVNLNPYLIREIVDVPAQRRSPVNRVLTGWSRGAVTGDRLPRAARLLTPPVEVAVVELPNGVRLGTRELAISA
jgi:hypothetical protein